MATAEQTGTYVLDGTPYHINKGDPLPDGAEFQDTGGAEAAPVDAAAEERAKGAAPENKAKAGAPETKSA